MRRSRKPRDADDDGRRTECGARRDRTGSRVTTTQRSILIALVTAVVAAALAAGATILLTDDDDLAISSPPIATESPFATASASVASPSAPGGSVQPAPAPGRTSAPATTSSATQPPSTQIRSAKSVDCDDEESKCSRPYGMNVEDGKLHIVPFDDPSPDYSGVPRISMTSEFRKDDKTQAKEGDDLDAIHVEVIVENKTEETFVFAKREIVLDIYRDGKLYDTLATTGEGFNMTPGGKMTATFDRPITADGDYLWQAKTWYYEK
jgi:hypothetical protein